MDHGEGPIQSTGNPLDLAIHGEGFFVVELANGDRVYTRNGHFSADRDGQLVTAQGDIVLGADSQPIVVDPALGPVIVNNDGTVVVGDQPPIALALVTFDNLQGLRHVGASFFSTNQPELLADNAGVAQGMLEGSNVQTVLQLTAMIETTRAYQASQRTIDFDHDLARKMAERLPQLRA